MFAASYMGEGLFVTSDKGDSWLPVPGFRNIPCSQVVVDKGNPLRVWVTFEIFVAKSYDGGVTWSKWGLPDRRLAGSIGIQPNDGETVYIGAGGAGYSDKKGTIFKTEDGGGSWQQLNIVTDEMVTFLAINPSRTQEIWAVTGAGTSSVYNSYDGGVTWTLFDFGAPPDFDVNQIVFDPQDAETLYASGSYGIWKSSDGGRNWDWLGLFEYCNALALDPNDPKIVYAATYNPDQDYFFVSLNAGANWVSYPIDKLSSLLAIAVSPDEKGRLFAGSIYSGIFSSQDSGQTWTAINNGIKAVIVYDSAVNLKKPTEILVGTIAGVFLKDEENGWHQLTRNNSDAVVYDPFDSRTMYSGQDLSLAKSIDGGETWVETDVKIGGDSYSVVSIAIDSANSQVLYLGTGHYEGNRGHVCKSMDGGESWEDKSFVADAITEIKIDQHRPKWVYAATFTNGIFLSIDGGENWTNIGLTEYVVNDLSIYKIANMQTMRHPAYFFAAADEASNHVLAGTNSGMVGYTGSTIYGSIYRFDSTDIIYPASVWLDIGIGKNTALIFNTGTYLIAKPPVGNNYTLYCQAQDYINAEISGISVWSKAELSYDFYLKPGSNNDVIPGDKDNGKGGGGGQGGCFIESLRY